MLHILERLCARHQMLGSTNRRDALRTRLGYNARYSDVSDRSDMSDVSDMTCTHENSLAISFA